MSDHSTALGWLLGGITLAVACALFGAGVLVGWWLL